MKRFRFSFDDSYEDPHYVNAETEEQARATFEKQWAGYIESAKEADRDDDIPPVEEAEVSEVGQEEHKWGPRPTCCDKINEIRDYDFYDGPPIRLCATRRNPETGDYFSLVDPHWVIRKVGFEVEFCPFCGTKLPGVEKKESLPQPIWDGDDDYCGTCEDRNRGCECNPPEAAYRIKA